MPAFDCGYNCVSVVDPIRLTFLMTIQYKSFSTDNYIFASHKSSKVECLFHENEEPSLKHATYIHSFKCSINKSCDILVFSD